MLSVTIISLRLIYYNNQSLLSEKRLKDRATRLEKRDAFISRLLQFHIILFLNGAE
jgi:hypothetical protein